MTVSPWWAPHVHADRRPFLLARARITAALRAWFAARDFVEVEAAILQVSPGNEAHLHAFATELIGADGQRTPLYLHTSPEFACKKLLAAGERRIFTFARVFRNRERGPLHHPEFTMLEWYRADEPYEVLMDDCAALLAAAAAGGRDQALHVPRPRGRSVRGARAAHGRGGLRAVTPASTCWRRSTTATRSPPAATGQGLRVAADDTWADIFSRVLVEKIEPQARHRPRHHPRRISGAEAALARPKPPIRASPSASSSMPAASSSPTPSAN